MTAPNREPRVTVFIPAYNAEPYIAEAIDSILAQTWTDFELLLIDDGSGDATAEVMTRYSDDSRVRIVCNLENRGQPWTRNEGLRLARGEYIALLDADDIATPDRLQRQLEYLDSHPEIAVLGSSYYVFNETRTRTPTSNKREILGHEELMALCLFMHPISHSTIMARTQSMRDSGYDPAFAGSEDYDLWSRMLRQYRFAILPNVLLFHRQHPAQVTNNFDEECRASRDAILSREFLALGLRFCKEDIAKHQLIHKGHNNFRAIMGCDIDLAYVSWAREWLEQLIAANAQRRIYPEPAFSRVATLYRARLCRKAMKSAGLRAVVLEFARSGLKWRVPANLIQSRLGTVYRTIADVLPPTTRS